MSRQSGIRRSVTSTPRKKSSRLEQLVTLKQLASRKRWSFAPSRRQWIGLSIGLCTLLLAWMLTGCASQTAPSEGRAPISASLTSPCPELSPLQEGTGAAVLRWITSSAKSYRDCSAKHRALVEAVK